MAIPTVKYFDVHASITVLDGYVDVHGGNGSAQKPRLAVR